MRWASSAALSVVSLLAGCSSFDADRASALRGAKVALNPPVLSVTGASRTSITLHVCGAPEYGAPAGFSLQWVTQAALEANGGVFPSSDSETYCAASYSGQPKDSTFDLGSGACVDVTIDGLPIVAGPVGASSECIRGLECGTAYAIRAFAHGDDEYAKSDFGQPIAASTEACAAEGCALSQGYWKNHEESWPVSSLALGSTTYDQEQLLAILHTPVKGNGLVSLAHQLIAAMLNAASGAGGADQLIDDAGALIGDLVVPPAGDGWLAPSATGELTSELDAFNNSGDCEDDD